MKYLKKSASGKLENILQQFGTFSNIPEHVTLPVFYPPGSKVFSTRLVHQYGNVSLSARFTCIDESHILHVGSTYIFKFCTNTNQ